jgi:DNA modification methylase
MAEKIRIDQIVIGERRRKEFNQDKLEELAQSIKNLGLIEPVILTQDNQLIAGERRIRAHLLLGEEEILFERMEVVDDWHHKTLELEENTMREDLSWPEVLAAKLELHEMRQQKYGGGGSSLSQGGRREVGGWTVDDTAELLGESHGTTAQDLKLGRAIRQNPELGRKDSKIAALKALQVGETLSLKRELAGIMAQVGGERGEKEVEILNGDSSLLLKEFEEESFDFCITDPPYSIGLHDMQNTFPTRGEVRGGVEFDDSPQVLETVEKVMREVYRVLKEGSHCYVFFAIARFTEMKRLLQEVGFWVQPTPLLWVKNNALNLRPHICFPVNYEPAWYCSKGYPPRPFPKPQLKSTFDYPILSGSKKVHPAQKPLSLIKEWIEFCSQPKERGLDPFLGGGTFTRALKETGRLGVGIELDKDWAFEARLRLEEEVS